MLEIKGLKYKIKVTYISVNSVTGGEWMERLVWLITLQVLALLNIRILLPHLILFKTELALR